MERELNLVGRFWGSGKIKVESAKLRNPDFVGVGVLVVGLCVHNYL